MKYVPFKTLVVYKTKEYAYDWINDFFKLYNNAVKEIVEQSAGWDIILHDESIISLRPPIDYLFRGHRANRVYVDPQVDKKFVDEILYTLRINAHVIYDDNLKG